MEKGSGIARPWIVIAAVLLCGRLGIGQQESGKQVQAEAKGQLKVTGQHVEKLVLVDDKGQMLPFSGTGMDKPLELAPGRYRPQEILLKGGYQCTIWADSDFARVEVKAGESAELKVGAPLSQGLTVQREGKLFELGYALKGIGRETYIMTDRSRPPEFAVYKGDRRVGGGQFDFG